MKETIVLEKKVIQCARQLYYHCGLREKMTVLNKKNLDPAEIPIEVKKMRTLYSTDEHELDKIVRLFLQQSQKLKKKGTLEEFMELIDIALNSFCDGKRNIKKQLQQQLIIIIIAVIIAATITTAIIAIRIRTNNIDI